MPPEVFAVAGCHCGALICSNLWSFDVDQACTPAAGAAQSNEPLNAAREAVAAAVVFKNFRRVLDSVCAPIVVLKISHLSGYEKQSTVGFWASLCVPGVPCALLGIFCPFHEKLRQTAHGPKKS